MTSQSAQVTKAIKAQIALKAVSNKDFAPVVGLSLSGLYTRLRGERDWKIEEVAQAAAYFQVPVSALFAPKGESK